MKRPEEMSFFEIGVSKLPVSSGPSFPKCKMCGVKTKRVLFVHVVGRKTIKKVISILCDSCKRVAEEGISNRHNWADGVIFEGDTDGTV